MNIPEDFTLEDYLKECGVSSVDDLSVEQLEAWCVSLRPNQWPRLDTNAFKWFKGLEDGYRAGEPVPVDKFIGYIRRAIKEKTRMLIFWYRPDVEMVFMDAYDAREMGIDLDVEHPWKVEFLNEDGELVRCEHF